MPTVSQIIKFRNRRRNTDTHKPWLKVSLILAVLISLLAAGGSLAALSFYMDATHELPAVKVLSGLLEPPNGTLLQPTRFYDRSHQHVILTLENPTATEKRYLKIGEKQVLQDEQFSPYLIYATIATNDPNFWHHPGYSVFGLLKGEHPTIAQKLISDLVIDEEPISLKRNIRERILAAQVTAQYGRKKILEWYLNSAQYGDLIYGADAAAQAYFGKSASNISLAQAAMLAAIGQTPAMSPIEVPRWLKTKQEKIIQAMAAQGLVSDKEAKEALREGIQFQARQELHSIAPTFTELVLKQLGTQLSLDRVRRGGLEIITTLDYDLLLQSNCVTKIQITMLAETSGPGSVDASDCEAVKLLPVQGVRNNNAIEGVNASVVILDPHTGQILSLVGEDAAGKSTSFSNSHPVGTIISPFIYLSAFSRGLSPASMLWDIPADGSEQENTSAYHGPVRARMAMVNDYMSATAEILSQVGVEKVISTEEGFGFSSASQNLSLDADLMNLYSQQWNLLEITSAYSVLANQGMMAGRKISLMADEDLSPTSIIRVLGVDGKVWLDWSSPQSMAITNPQLSYLATDVLSDEAARVPSLGHPNPLEIGKHIAVKSGVSMDGSNVWTVGYTPDISIGVWMGSPVNDAIEVSAEIANGLWAALMRFATSRMPIKDYTIPSGINLVQVCDPSGLLVSKLCPSVVEEVFLAGNEPTVVDNLYQKLQVNRETGLLATAFTPPDLVEDKTFLMMPKNAITWAKLANLPIPPDSYDEISSFQQYSQDVHITSPLLFSAISGKVSIFGSAIGSDFSYYRLQIGQGLNPQEWIQLGEDETSPVEEGLLGVWDTQGLEGSYILQLLVVRRDQRIDRAVLQVTVDNTLPEIKIMAPTDSEKFTYQQDGSIMIQVSASDNLMLDRIEFYVDGELVSSLIQPPYVILYSMEKGEHNLRVQAYDLAGNKTDSTISFIVE